MIFTKTHKKQPNGGNNSSMQQGENWNLVNAFIILSYGNMTKKDNLVFFSKKMTTILPLYQVTGQSVPITQKQPNISHKMLGIMENPSGDYSDEYRNIKSKAHSWKMSITNQYLTRAESKLFHQNFFLPSMHYHLTVGTFNDKQLNQLQHLVIQSLLPRMGYNSNMPKAVIYGPTSSGGMGIQSLRALQGTQKIKHVLQAYRRKLRFTTFYIFHSSGHKLWQARHALSSKTHPVDYQC